MDKPINFMDIIANPNSAKNRQIRQDRSRSINKTSDGTSCATFEVPTSMDQETKFQSNKSPLFGAMDQPKDEGSNPRFKNLPVFGTTRSGNLKDVQQPNNVNQNPFSPFGNFHQHPKNQEKSSEDAPLQAKNRGYRTMAPKPYVDSQ